MSQNLTLSTKAAKRGSRTEILHTLNEWVMMTGRDSRTILAGLKRADIFPAPGERIPFKSIEAALFGEDYVQKVRGMKLDNDQKERDAARESGDLMTRVDIEEFFTAHVVLPLTSAFAQMPNELAPRLVGADREAISAAIADYIETKIKPPMRERLQKRKEP